MRQLTVLTDSEPAALKRPAAIQGYELWRGPARFTRDKIVLIATGYGRPSTNEKTGPMIQTYILVAGLEPTVAVKTGADRAICGDCAFRPLLADSGPACYVNKGHGPLAVYRSWQLGRYPRVALEDAGARALELGRPIRVGAYGDPAMVPVGVWRALLAGSRRWTGYTHQWRAAPFLRDVCMASVDTVDERTEAKAAGWRTFRVSDSGPDTGEIACPAAIESGKKTTCARCGLCNGARADDRRRDIVIAPHGGAIALATARGMARES